MLQKCIFYKLFEGRYRGGSGCAVIFSARHRDLFLPVVQMDSALFHIIGNHSKRLWAPFEQKVEANGLGGGKASELLLLN